MFIIPLNGLSINNVHAPANIPVEVSEEMGRLLISEGVARIGKEPVRVATDPKPEPEPAKTATLPKAETTEAPVQRGRKRK